MHTYLKRERESERETGTEGRSDDKQRTETRGQRQSANGQTDRGKSPLELIGRGTETEGEGGRRDALRCEGKREGGWGREGGEFDREGRGGGDDTGTVL